MAIWRGSAAENSANGSERFCGVCVGLCCLHCGTRVPSHLHGSYGRGSAIGPPLGLANMQNIRNSLLRHIRLGNSIQLNTSTGGGRLFSGQARCMCSASNNSNSEHVTARVMDLVKKFDKIDASKVTEKADFQKDLCLDSLDRVELVMAFEQEFSMEIPDEKADKLACCADVVKYILSETPPKPAESS